MLAWYHPYDEPPQWEVPVIEEIGDPAWSDFYSSSYVIRTIPQEMSENGADPAHFQFVHGTDNVAEIEKYETDGPCSVMLSKQTFVTPRGVTEGRIDVYNYGPGFSKVWFSGIVDAINIATTTPIDDDTTQVRFNFIVRKLADEKLTSTVADAFVKEINKQVQEDRPIWEHKRFLPTPALADTDGPIMQFRKLVQAVLRRALRSRRLTCPCERSSQLCVEVLRDKEGCSRGANESHPTARLGWLRRLDA